MRYKRAADMSSARSLVPDAFPVFRWLERDRLQATSTSTMLGLFEVQDGSRAQPGSSLARDELATGFDESRAVSPDGAVRILRDGYDLSMLEMRTGSVHRLTNDGTYDVAYGVVADIGSEPLTRSKRRRISPDVGTWSPCSRYFATVRVDQRGLRSLPYVVCSPPDTRGHRVPEAQIFRYALPGDTNVPTASVVLLDRLTHVVREVKVPPFVLSLGTPNDGSIVWTDDGRFLFIGVESRDFKSLTVYRVDAEAGNSEMVLVDRGEKSRRPFPFPNARMFAPVGNGGQLVLRSTRDGRAHLFLYEVSSGQLIRQLTEGPWSIVELSAVDTRERTVFFSAAGREPGRDPYLRHFYRVSLDGGNPLLLTPEDADHQISLSPKLDAFVDVYSTVSQAPTIVLRGASGALRSELWRTDPTPLVARGWVAPERFSVTAADGKTVLHGTLYLPPKRKTAKIPIIDSIYGGPQQLRAPIRFPGAGAGAAMALSQLGFAVFVLDARGTPLLASAARDATYGQDFGSPDVVAADHAAAIQQLSDRYDFLDAERVGIYGHSWGGYYTIRLMAQRPDLFKVGVATAPCNDNYAHSFSHDRWFGLPSELPESYQVQSNFPLAAQIEGRLLIVAGDADDDTHPFNTILMAGALAKANRNFDMLILPDLNHSTTATDGYVTRRTWDYFVRHLLGTEPPPDIKLPDIDYW
ncbi:S9 family peptidase [Rhizobium etli]|uniref:S9 family peptidase n=1 Tax=Rhizobium etli TaxID=29449 RepID=UPI0018AD3E8E|nr:DPP IV N-terminal domain-containing protein [Rhizobium etli]